MSETDYLSEAKQALGAAIATGPAGMTQAEWFLREATARAVIATAEGACETRDLLREVLAELQGQRQADDGKLKIGPDRLVTPTCCADCRFERGRYSCEKFARVPDGFTCGARKEDTITSGWE